MATKKTTSTVPAKTPAKPAAKSAAKPAAKAPAKPASKAPAKAKPPRPAQSLGAAASTMADMARVEEIRMRQRMEGYFDCFAKAYDGYCDQDECLYREECLEMSRLMTA